MPSDAGLHIVSMQKAVLWRARVGWQEGLPPTNSGV